MTGRWGFEVNYDGLRAIGYVEGRRDLNRASDITIAWPELALAERGFVVDGKSVIQQDRPRRFQALAPRMHQGGLGTVRAIAPMVAAGVTIAGVQAVATAVVPEPAVRTLIQLADTVQRADGAIGSDWTGAITTPFIATNRAQAATPATNNHHGLRCERCAASGDCVEAAAPK